MSRFVALTLVVVLCSTAIRAQEVEMPIPILGGLFGRAKAKEANKGGNTDAEILKKAKLNADDAKSLIGYFQSRSLSDDQSKKIKDLISKLGADEFWVRERSTEEVVKFGASALGPLKEALTTQSDPEMLFRCEDARKRIETVSQASVAIAAARQLAKLKSIDAVPSLLSFIPTADTPVVVEEIRKALIPLAMKDGKPHPDLLTALKDNAPARRLAAAIALNEGAKSPDAVAAVKAMLGKETDTDVKFLTSMSLVKMKQGSDVVPNLITLLPDLPRGRLWQAEDLLLQLAGNNAPKAKYGKTTESVVAYKDAWQKWWTENGSKTKWDTFNFQPRVQGTLLLIEWNNQGWGNGQITLLGPNLKERVKLQNLAQPMDACLLPGELIAVAEQNNSRVTIRNFQNDIVTTIQENQPIGLQLLPSGKLFVSNRNGCAEYDLKGTKGWKYDRPNNNHDVMGARRLLNGETVVFVNSDQKNNCVRVDDKGKEIGKPFALGQPYYNPAIEGVNNEEFLVTDYEKIQKYNVKENKVTWSHNVRNVTSLQKLPNGNFLYVIQNSNKIVEITPDKEEVWEHTVSNGMRLAKAYRQ